MIKIKKKRKDSNNKKLIESKSNIKKSHKKLWYSLLVLFAFFLIIGAFGSDAEDNDTNQTLVILSNDLVLERNDSVSLEFSDSDSKSIRDEKISCSSTDEAIAVVINHKVYGLSEGEAVITCQLDGQISDQIKVEVISIYSEEVETPAIVELSDPPPSAVTEKPTESSDRPAVTEPSPPKEPPPALPSSGRLLTISYIDVGQGDSILIQTPNNKNILIDAGTSSYAGKIANYLRARGVNKIDVLIATHPHADHIGGMAHIIESFEIGMIYMPKAVSTTKTYENLLLAIQNKGLSIHTAKAGVIIDIDSSIEARLLAPISESYSDINQYSAVLRVTYNNTSFLFTGDAGRLSENEMLSSGVNLSADVLKVGHHGSSTSTTQAFLDAVSPKYAIIPVGKDNRYGHPSDQVLQRLENMGVVVYRTDLDGTIVFSSDGNSITIQQ